MDRPDICRFNYSTCFGAPIPVQPLLIAIGLRIFERCSLMFGGARDECKMFFCRREGWLLCQSCTGEQQRDRQRVKNRLSTRYATAASAGALNEDQHYGSRACFTVAFTRMACRLEESQPPPSVFTRLTDVTRRWPRICVASRWASRRFSSAVITSR